MQILFQAVLMSMCYYCSRSVLCFGKVSQLSKLHDRKCPNNASYVTEHLQRSPKCQAFVGGTNTGVTLRYACNVKRRTNATSHFKEIQFFISYIYLLRALIIHTNKFINVIKHVTLLYMYNYINTCSRKKNTPAYPWTIRSCISSIKLYGHYLCSKLIGSYRKISSRKN